MRRTPLKYARLGSSGLKVSPTCLGTNMMGAYVDERRSAELIDVFLETGGNFIDTADIYSAGASEEAIGKALKRRRHEAIVATKVAGPAGEGPNDKGASRAHIMASAEASLRRLQTDYIDLYVLHFWDNDTALSESLRAMDDLVRQGKVRYVGVSNYQSWQAVQALWTADQLGLDPIRSVQLRYSFLRREPEAEAFPAAIEHGLAVTPYWLLEAGVFTGKYRRGEKPDTDSRFAHRPGMADMFMNDTTLDVAERVQAIAERTGHSPTDVVIAWALAKPAITSVIIGTSRVEQVRANNAAADVRLSDEDLAELDQLGAGPPPPAR